MVLLFSMMISQAQVGIFSIGVGASSFNVETEGSSNIGLGISLSVGRVYFDVASNLAHGKGEQLDFSSDYTYPTNKISAGVVNIGYIIPIKKIHIIPTIGYGFSNRIYQDPIGWDTYYNGKSDGAINLGVIGSISLTDNIKLYAGAGTFERFKAGITFSTGY